MATITTFTSTQQWPSILSTLNTNFDNINDDLIIAEADIVVLEALQPSAAATTTTKGLTRLSVAPASPTVPIAVGDNDTRLPTQWENDALVGTTGTPSSSNKYVTATDPAYTGIVLTTTNQTIAGTKTFTSIPVLPASDPTTANQAVRKSYADSLVATTTWTTTDGIMTLYWVRRGLKFYYGIWGSVSGGEYTLKSDAATLARLATLWGTISTSTAYSGLDGSGTTSFNIYDWANWTSTTGLWENNMLTSVTIT